MSEVNFWKYFTSHSIYPNFYCSPEYWKKGKFKIVDTPNLFEVRSQEGWLLIPRFEKEIFNFSEPFYAGFSGFYCGKFLDYQFIYDPKNFRELSGGEWRKIRHNLTISKRELNESLGIVLTGRNCSLSSFKDFMLTWQNLKQESELYDPEIMVKFLINGDHRLLFMGLDSKKIYGIAVFDLTPIFINFRYCEVLPGITGLSDYCRVEFYQWIDKHYPNKLVNDGGSLDKPSLYKYKQFLNPMSVSKIRSLLK